MYILHVHRVGYTRTYYMYTWWAIYVHTTCTHGKLYKYILHVHMVGYKYILHVHMVGYICTYFMYTW